MTASWVPSSWDAVKAGDTVRLEHGDGSLLIRRALALDHWPNALYIDLVGDNSGTVRRLQWLVEDGGWALFTPAPTTPPLPTEPGIYMGIGGTPWELLHTFPDQPPYWAPLLIGGGHSNRDPLDSAPFVRLEPIADTAKKVLDRFAEVWTSDEPIQNLSTFKDDLAMVAAEFGVS